MFRRTRVPVHLVAEMMAQGASAEEILEGYPSLTKEPVRLASLYARASQARTPVSTTVVWTKTSAPRAFAVAFRGGIADALLD